jgi:hypothetical protein
MGSLFPKRSDLAPPAGLLLEAISSSNKDPRIEGADLELWKRIEAGDPETTAHSMSSTSKAVEEQILALPEKLFLEEEPQVGEEEAHPGPKR